MDQAQEEGRIDGVSPVLYFWGGGAGMKKVEDHGFRKLVGQGDNAATRLLQALGPSPAPGLSHCSLCLPLMPHWALSLSVVVRVQGSAVSGGFSNGLAPKHRCHLCKEKQGEPSQADQPSLEKEFWRGKQQSSFKVLHLFPVS